MILDATAGYRMMWFNKQRPDTVYMDLKRDVHPDIMGDFCHLPFRDDVFDIVVFDPPHTSAGKGGIFYQRFGALRASKFAPIIYRASRELFRVLKAKGVLLFKWNTHDYSLKRAIGLFPYPPLFGQKLSYKTVSGSSTYWATFQKQVLESC